MRHISDALVIGSGIVGSATAFALLRAGIRRVNLVDKGPLVSGMTRRRAGLVHPFAHHPALGELAAAGFGFYNTWGLHLGAGKSQFTITGAAVLPSSPDALRLLQADAPSSASTEIVDGSALAAQFPGLGRGLARALYTQNAGYADAVQTTQAFVAAARARGLQVHTGAQVRQIVVERGQIRGLVTSSDTFEAPLVVVAAGGWSERILAPLGIAVHLRFRRGVVLFYDQPPTLTQGHPILLDETLASFLRPHPYHMSAGGTFSPDPVLTNADSLDEAVTPADAGRVSDFAASLIPGFAGATPRRSHTIFYDTPADGLPTVGRARGLEGLLLAVGFGNAAFAVAPAVGDALAQLVVDGASRLDISAFDPARLM